MKFVVNSGEKIFRKDEGIMVDNYSCTVPESSSNFSL